MYTLFKPSQTAVQAAGGNLDKVIPLFITAAMPLWFTYLSWLLFYLLQMSTLSAQFHVQGTAFGRDIYRNFSSKTGGSQ